MPGFGVSADKEKALRKKMASLSVREEEIIESFIRSSGPGGQNVNKTSTCVYLKHIPTGIEVKCQRERSQSLNRYLARQLLLGKIEAARNKALLLKKQQREKIRRQKRKRPKKIKLMILEAKRRHSQKKQLRSKIREIEL